MANSNDQKSEAGRILSALDSMAKQIVSSPTNNIFADAAGLIRSQKSAPMANRVFAIWSDESACYVRFDQMTGSRIEPTLASSSPFWFERDDAQAAVPQISELTGFRDLRVQQIDSEDGI